METKTCTKCGVEKFLSDFSPDKRHTNGLQSHCKKCHNVWQKKNKENHNTWTKKYRKTIRGYVGHLMDNIKSRCNNIKVPSYKDYGGRGIRCLFTVEEFFDWVIANNIDPRGKSIHRINNAGNYALNNIKFLTKSEHTKLHWLQKRLNIKGDKNE